MSIALAALLAAAARLLQADGHSTIAQKITRGRLELTGLGESWTMGSRSVTAHRLALVLPAPEFIAFKQSPSDLDLLRSAFSLAMRSPDTELAELYLVLELPTIALSWAEAYRDAETNWQRPSAPAPEQILDAAATLLDLKGYRIAAEILGRAGLEQAELPDTQPPLSRILVRLIASDLEKTQRDPFLAEAIRAAVRDAAIRAEESVVVEIALGIVHTP